MHDETEPVNAATPIWHNILVRNIVATGGTRDAGLIIGLPEMPAREIVLDNVSIGAHDGLRIGYADGVSLKNVKIDPNVGPALLVEDTVTNLTH
jgi:hypothetical protein